MSAAVPTLRRSAKGGFQDLDQAALVRPATKYSELIDSPKDVLAKLDLAWSYATESPRGPAHLTFPMDVQRAAMPHSPMPPRSRRSLGSFKPSNLPPWKLSADPLAHSLSRRAKFLQRRRSRPSSHADRFRIPVQTPIWDRGICDMPQETFLGVVGAASCDPGLPADSDCILVAGELRDYRLRQ